MGASCWSYFVDHDEDLGAAFSRLRREVFERGDFWHPAAPEKASYASIEELVEACEADGTHSILDMERATTEAAPPPPSMKELQDQLIASILGGQKQGLLGIVYRMSEDELMRCFGTQRPTRRVIESGESHVWKACQRGTGRHTLVFDEAADRAVGIYFAGVSGD